MSLTNYEFRSCSRRPLCACQSGFGPTTTVAATRLVQRWCGFITIQGAKQRSKRSVSTSDKHEGCSGSGFCHLPRSFWNTCLAVDPTFDHEMQGSSLVTAVRKVNNISTSVSDSAEVTKPKKRQQSL